MHFSFRDVDPPPKEKDDNNAIVRLIYGKVRTYGTNAGRATILCISIVNLLIMRRNSEIHDDYRQNCPVITFSDAALLLRFFTLIVGETFTTHTQFYQWPLYVAGFSDIHQSLEAGLARGDIETNNTDQTSNQEVRYTNTYTKAYVLLIQMYH